MRQINGQTLKKMLLSAANNLYNNYPEIDALNVFPVPDGDTGMNMNLTLTSGAKEILARNDDDVSSIASTFSRGLLMGARGNSGVITSQIFRGFAASLKGKTVLTVADLSEALTNGTTVAYKAVMRPVEGTILTVIRQTSEAFSEYAQKEISLLKAMHFIVDEAKKSLDHTPDLLPVLKEVGVVDSGGAGLVKIFEGMESALNGVFIEKNEVTSINKKTVNNENKSYQLSLLLMLGKENEKKPFSLKRFTSTLKSQDANLEITQNDDVVSIKICVKNLADFFNYAQNYGEFKEIKIANLNEEESLPADEKESNNEAEPLKAYGLVSVSAGKGIDEYFLSVGVNQIVSGGQTMNPSIEDIVSAIRKCHAKNVFVLPNNSNIIMAALQASDVLMDEINVKVVPTKTIPQGVVASTSFNPDASVDENFEAMKESYAALKSGSITYAIKDTSIDGIEVIKDYFMGLFDKHIVVCEKKKINALYKLVDKMVDENSYLVTIFVGEDVKDEEMEVIKSYFENKYDWVEFDIRRGDQPVYSFFVGVE